ncbi:hypothetical protein NCCP2716_11950 [Sporosarcina sp. NCCP-2716]|uniref:hypothetical protein n=1 Tax=Sporosarcina sp. NCCP-2716 TaxID=2943679 RepID=UPI00203B4DD7|nr:hypothetical protein [Sporosarcina sp. NCCP-2716]GKV68697.1 hypothetical protein NCCP2716_11950 [Sporosarcina sp. NCCP-2716]
MDPRTKAILEQVSSAAGLQRCRLHTYDFFERPSAFGGSDIILSAVWLPEGAASPGEEELMPVGAVSVDYSIRFRQLILAVTTGGVSGAVPLTEDTDKAVFFRKWAEMQTGLTFGETLTVTNRTETGFEAVLSYGGFPVSTESQLQVEWDADGRLLTAMLPLRGSDEFESSQFDLSLEAVEPLVRQQLTLIRLPIEEEERFADYYAIDEVHIAQDGTVLPYFTEEQGAQFPGTLLSWEAPSDERFERQPVEPFRAHVSADEAFSIAAQAPSVLDETTLRHVTESSIRFLSAEAANESGDWELYRVFRQPGIIEAVCRKIGEIPGPLRRKLVLLLEPETFEVLNYMDSNEMAQLFEGFTQPRIATVTQEEAFDEMVSFITMDPVYVYDQGDRRYKLCGLLDSDQCVDAVTGVLKNLNDL